MTTRNYAALLAQFRTFKGLVLANRTACDNDFACQVHDNVVAILGDLRNDFDFTQPPRAAMVMPATDVYPGPPKPAPTTFKQELEHRVNRLMGKARSALESVSSAVGAFGL